MTGNFGMGLRPATEGDREFCFALHEATMREYVAAIWGWDDAVQRDFFDQRFDPAATQVVTLDGLDVGVLRVEQRDDVTYLALIEIDPDHTSPSVRRGARVTSPCCGRPAGALLQPGGSG